MSCFPRLSRALASRAVRLRRARAASFFAPARRRLGHLSRSHGHQLLLQPVLCRLHGLVVSRLGRARPCLALPSAARVPVAGMNRTNTESASSNVPLELLEQSAALGGPDAHGLLLPRLRDARACWREVISVVRYRHLDGRVAGQYTNMFVVSVTDEMFRAARGRRLKALQWANVCCIFVTDDVSPTRSQRLVEGWQP